MFLKNIHIHNYKIFNDIEVNLEKSDISNVFSLASVNGGGKSTLLQFIFIMLNCFMEDRKKQYIINLLEGIPFTNKDKNNLIDFTVTNESIDYNIKFFLVSPNFENRDFDLYQQEKSLTNQFEHTSIKLRQLERREEQNRYEYEARQDHRFLAETKENRLEKEQLKKEQDLLKSELHLIQDSWEKFKLSLKENNLLYITHIDNETILLIKTNMTEELLIDLTYKVFLASPSSQVFHFFTKEEKNLIFKSSKKEKKSNKEIISRNRMAHYFEDEEKKDKSYYEIIENSKLNLNNFFTYEFFSSNIILEAFEKAFREDRKSKLSNGEYGEHFDALSDIFENFLEGKTISVDEDFSRVIYKFKNNSQELSPLDLSHGELKKLSIFIWLKYLVEEDSIVLMDEIDIALHPSWQYDLVDDLEEWSKNTQFFVATHSAQILSSTYYKNLILLQKEDNKSILHQPNKPLDNNDINTVIDLIMGTNHLPKKLDKWHIEYRNLIKNGKEDSLKAKEIKTKILDWESANSSFFRRIDFFKKMKK